MYTLDTNAVIYHLHDDPAVREFMDSLTKTASPIYISAVSIAELLRFPDLSPKEEADIFSLLPIFSVIPLDAQIANIAGALGRMYRLKLAGIVVAKQIPWI